MNQVFLRPVPFQECGGRHGPGKGIFGDSGKYIPEDFGGYVDSENIGLHLAEYFAARGHGGRTRRSRPDRRPS